MATKINDSEMSSDQTRHTAMAVSGSRYGSWTVTWLPGVCLSYDQAITAMTIAEVVATHEFQPVGDEVGDVDPIWLHIDGWAAELGISGPHAVAAASLSPEDHADMPAVVTLPLDSQAGRRGCLLSADPATGMARVRIDGETVTMPAPHLQHVGGEPAQNDEDAPAGRAALVGVMTAAERAALLVFITRYAPGVFVAALADQSETFADVLGARIEARQEAEYLAGHEPVIAWRETAAR